MSFQTYNLNVPNPPNNPATDVPLMKVNTNSIANLINQDHFGFNLPMGGLHRQVTLPLSGGAPGTIPSNLLAGEGTLYTKSEQSTGMLTETDLFYSPDNTTNQYQLTRTITGSFALFGTNTNYTGPSTTLGGWTFLPGGLILQYGSAVSTAGLTVITFPVAMTNLYSLSAIRNQNAFSDTSYGYVSASGTGFTFSANSSTNGAAFYWTAIGS